MKGGGAEKNGRQGSLMGFLFMPQFSRCLVSFGHVIPVFMRTIAIMFATARLIDRDHPALRYGYPGVPRTGIGALLSSAFSRLRGKRATPYQWGIYAAVVLLCIGLLGAAGHAVLAGAWGLGRVAEAQIFVLTGKDTSTDVAQGMPAGVDTDPFDFRVTDPCPATGCGGHDDFAIMLLDKVLRQGTNNLGGYLQNAMQAMMAVYNAGALVIAGFMLLWAVLSVVVDTAKTGTIGGGKHNMVWAPIRIVFALGLLMPLGANCMQPSNGGASNTVCGFSAGQLMVQKIAEWGSNFGTNAWNAYAQSATSASLMMPIRLENATPMVQAYANMWLCRVFYNGYQYQSTDGENGNVAASPVGDYTVIRMVTASDENQTSWEYAFGSKQDKTLCGKVRLPNPVGDPLTRLARAGGLSPLQTAIVEFKAAVLGDPYYLNIGGVGATTAAPGPSWNGLFFYRGGDCPGCATQGTSDIGMNMAFDQWARAWACDMAMHLVVGADPAPVAGDPVGPGTPATERALNNSPLVLAHECGAYSGAVSSSEELYDVDRVLIGGLTLAAPDLGICTRGGPGSLSPNVNNASGDYPDATPTDAASEGYFSGDGHYNCIQRMTQLHSDVVNQAIETALPPLYQAFLDDIVKQGRGWAEMGAWHLRLTQASQVLQWAQKIHVTVEPGALTYTSLPRQVDTLVRASAIGQATLKMMEQASTWWSDAALVASLAPQTVLVNDCYNGAAGATTRGLSPCPPTNPAFVPTTGTVRVLSPAAISGGASEIGMVGTSKGYMQPNADAANQFVKGVMDYTSGKHPLWILDVLQPGADNVYPFVQLIQIGQSILKMGIAMTAASAAMSFLGNLFAGFPLLSSLGPMAGMISAVSSLFILAGLFLTFWVPLLPFIRVAFAVMAWIVSVFEAVIMVPLAALNHISTEGEGLAGQAKNAWILWLNVLMRPVLTVAGFVGSILVFNGFIVYFNRAFAHTIVNVFTKADGLLNMLEWLVVTIIYVGSMYIIANSSFKLVDTIPNAFFRWMGGSHDTQFQDDSLLATMLQTASRGMGSVTEGVAGMGGQAGKSLRESMTPPPPQGTKP